MCVLIFSTTLIQNTSQFKKNSGRYNHKCIYVFISSTRYSFRFVIKTSVFSKYLKNIRTSNSTKICAEICGGTDGQKKRHEEASSRFTQFIERTEMGMTLQHLGESQQIRRG